MIISQKTCYTAYGVIRIIKKLFVLLALQVRRKKALQRAGQSRSEVRLAVTETTCAQWRAGCCNLVVGMGEASGGGVHSLWPSAGVHVDITEAAIPSN